MTKPVFSMYKMLLFILGWMITLRPYAQNPASTGGFQPNDSLSLEQILTEVLKSNPAMLKAREGITAAEAGIGLARSGYLPSITAEASYSHLGPVPEITMPGLGTLSLYPADNYAASVNIYQTIYDFHVTDRKVNVEKSSKDISTAQVEMVKQKLSLATANVYYSLVYLQEAINIKDQEIKTLKEHLDFVTRKKEAGTATDYEILSTQVKISGVENQKTDLETAQKNQLTQMNALLGLPYDHILRCKKGILAVRQLMNTDSLLNYAMEHRSEMALSNLKEQQASLKYESVKLENMPVVNAFASGGFKNGYIPKQDELKANYAAGIGIKVPIFDAHRQKNHLLLATSQINTVKQETDQARRDISTEVMNNLAAFQASVRKLEQSEIQVSHAREAHKLALVNFSAGTITNLELLDTETAESESMLNLLKSRIDCTLNQVKLNISLGNSSFEK